MLRCCPSYLIPLSPNESHPPPKACLSSPQINAPLSGLHRFSWSFGQQLHSSHQKASPAQWQKRGKSQLSATDPPRQEPPLTSQNLPLKVQPQPQKLSPTDAFQYQPGFLLSWFLTTVPAPQCLTWQGLPTNIALTWPPRGFPDPLSWSTCVSSELIPTASPSFCLSTVTLATRLNFVD